MFSKIYFTLQKTTTTTTTATTNKQTTTKQKTKQKQKKNLYDMVNIGLYRPTRN